MLDNKKVLVFDLGGVLIDLHIERSFAALREMGIDPSCLTEKNCLVNTYMMQYDRGDITTEEMFGYIASQLPRTVCKELGERLFTRLAEVWNMMLGEYAHYKLQRIRELRKRGHRVVMLSNTNQGHWSELERRFEATTGETMTDYFDALYLSYRMHCRKPEPEIFTRLLESENAKAEECIFFDDSAENCEAARMMGIDAVLLERNAPWPTTLMND